MAERLDKFLAAQGYYSSREKARRAVIEGKVTVNGVCAVRPSEQVCESDCITAGLLYEDYVGRGALKLVRALEVFSLALDQKVCLDIGASTGGFTQCCLRHGARKVYAVDVGSGQLDPVLRADTRVVSLEQTDARTLLPEQLPDIEFVCTDVSFISVRLLLPTIACLLSDGADAVILVKPQFEAGREHISRGGIVRGRKVHENVLAQVSAAAAEVGLSSCGLTFSPVGSENIEYLLWLRRTGIPAVLSMERIKDAVQQAEKYWKQQSRTAGTEDENDQN